VTSTDTHLTVVVHLTVAAERAYTVSAQFAEALRSAAGLPGIRMSVEGAGSTPRIPQPRDTGAAAAGARAAHPVRLELPHRGHQRRPVVHSPSGGCCAEAWTSN
jgi:hypothetical protein